MLSKTPFFNRYFTFAILVFWTLLSIGFTLSKSFISIGFIGLSLIGLISFQPKTLNKRDFWILACIVLVYLISFLSIINSSNTEEAYRKLVLKLPLLCLPLLVFTFQQINLKTQLTLVLIFSYFIYLPAFVSVYNYLINKPLFDDLILQSKPLPIEFGYGIYHIQFSILMALAVVLGFWFLKKTWLIKELKYEKIFLTIITLLNIIFIHILSARTGLLSMYLGIGLLVLSVLKLLTYKQKITTLILILTIPLLFYFASSSLQNRIQNSIQDFKVIVQKNDPNDYSFALRVQAWKNAFNLIEKQGILGTGIGDVEKDLNQNFETFNPQIEAKNRKNPHFQLIETAVESGIINAILLFLFLILLIIKGFKDHWMILSTITIMFLVSSCFESILERQASVVAFSVFIAFVYKKD